ncbi:unnamed protein product [Rotaria magnacalcarata]|uniref:G-protein coupled receptors family 1 profile domain-containing protein n=3 Tax=Rotaria magnacalcarata TaxID=392030 RepID=A0A815TLB5_9BILA|nr:unnamed protein product [Rotaria magnacalcarata]CAF3865014.1 unnamed protein product [Rotaria magnacalcarata]
MSNVLCQLSSSLLHFFRLVEEVGDMRLEEEEEEEEEGETSHDEDEALNIVIIIKSIETRKREKLCLAHSLNGDENIFELQLPLTISIHRGEVEGLYVPNFDLSNEYSNNNNNNNNILLPLNISNIDWYLISSSDSSMALLSPPTLNFFTSINTTSIITPSLSSLIRPMPLVKALPVAFVLSSIVVLCICGNVLVILSVFTFRPLRTVQNFFIVSLAFSDMGVAILVMPFHIVTHILKRWIFGKIMCQIFVTSDVLLCTSSILNLCAIALDRYWAISDPIHYARQRTIRRVFLMIMLVWMLSGTISIPPIIAAMLGSRELQNFNELQQCELSNNKAYVIYSACGSFYIPALIMTIVYAHVFIETKKRFRERAKAAAKLAKATRTDNNQLMPTDIAMNNSIKHKHHHHHHHHRHYHKKHVTKSSQTHSAGSSLKSSQSNGSVIDNFSVDDPEEIMRTNLSPTSSNNCPIGCLLTDINTSPELISINADSNNILQKTADALAIPLFEQYPADEKNIENGFLIQQQHAAVQTTDLSNKKRVPSKEIGRRSLFKGKSLATLMNERQKISLTRERRLSRTLGIIISVFLLCWLPFFVVYILSAFIDVSLYMKEPLPTLILWLGYINSACNPLIYTVFNVEFRTAFKRLLFPRSTHNSFAQRYSAKKNRN